MSKYLLESTFAQDTQIFQAKKNILDASVQLYSQGWLKTDKDNLRPGSSKEMKSSRN